MRKAFFLFFLLASTGRIMAQSPSDDTAALKRERQAIQHELSQIQGMYDKVKGQKKTTLGQLSMLNRKINLQERFIGSISKELKMIDDNIYLSNLEIYRLQKQLDTLKVQYARTVVYAYKNRSSYDYLNFIFSATSFNDAIKRISYLKSYRAYRAKQVTNILETQKLIAQRKQQQLGRKDQKNVALKNETKEKEVLDIQKKEKDAVVSKLKSQENDLAKQIAAKKKKDRDLNNAILAAVRRDIEKQKEAERLRIAAENKNTGSVTNPTTTTTTTSGNVTTRNTPTKKPESYLNLNAVDIALNSSFEKNRGKLPWPVDNGVVTYHFGSNAVPGTKLIFDSPGLTLGTPNAGAAVKSVFDGEVSVVNNNGDGTYAIVIRHGRYFTTYSNLSSTSVSRGSVVKTGQVIGKAGRDDDGSGGQIDFILMIEVKNVNPESWLR